MDVLALSEWVSVNIGWPVVGWTLLGAVVLLALATVAYEVTGEVQRKRRNKQRRRGARCSARHGRRLWTALLAEGIAEAMRVQAQQCPVLPLYAEDARTAAEGAVDLALVARALRAACGEGRRTP